LEKFDLCVIGAGPSGFAAAMRAIDFGKRVALIERGKVGGAGIFDGALSSKTLWELSESYKLTHNTNLGYTVYDSEVHFGSVMQQAHRAVAEKHVQLKQQIAYFQKSGQLKFFNGHAKFASGPTTR
jgi:dihydrolipoamide dehydrogenase